MAEIRQIAVRLRADFVDWLEEEAERQNRELEVQGSEYKVTAADVAGPMLEMVIQQTRAKELVRATDEAVK